jgi:hypothetical protein
MLNRFLWLAEAVRRILYDELGTQRVCVVRDTGLEVREPALFLTQPQWLTQTWNEEQTTLVGGKLILTKCSPTRGKGVHPFVNSDCKRALAIVRQTVAAANSNTGEFRFSVHFNIESS